MAWVLASALCPATWCRRGRFAAATGIWVLTDVRLILGLGDHAQVDTLQVHWPSGAVQTLGGCGGRSAHCDSRGSLRRLGRFDDVGLLGDNLDLRNGLVSNDRCGIHPSCASGWANSRSGGLFSLATGQRQPWSPLLRQAVHDGERSKEKDQSEFTRYYAPTTWIVRKGHLACTGNGDILWRN